VIYSHDGLRDSLTHLAAPTLFYEELRRELARSRRENHPISLVRFVLALSDRHAGNTDSEQLWTFEDEVLGFAHVLTRLCRSDDVCARMGELEFVCMIHGNDQATQSFITRILLTWRDENPHQVTRQPFDRACLEVSSLSSTEGESALDILARLDQVSANPH
jgi:GGDEF domain-containing protein